MKGHTVTPCFLARPPVSPPSLCEGPFGDYEVSRRRPSLLGRDLSSEEVGLCVNCSRRGDAVNLLSKW